MEAFRVANFGRKSADLRRRFSVQFLLRVGAAARHTRFGALRCGCLRRPLTVEYPSNASERLCQRWSVFHVSPSRLHAGAHGQPAVFATPLVRSRPHPTCRVLDKLVRPIGRHELHRHFACKQRSAHPLPRSGAFRNLGCCSRGPKERFCPWSFQSASVHSTGYVTYAVGGTKHQGLWLCLDLGGHRGLATGKTKVAIGPGELTA